MFQQVGKQGGKRRSGRISLLSQLNLSFFATLFLIFLLVYIISLRNYFVAHTLIEGWTILVAGAMFIFIRRSEDYYHNSFLVLISFVYLGTAMIDTMHMLSFKGSDLFPATDPGVTAQFWIAARMMESAGVLTAYIFTVRNLPRRIVKNLYMIMPAVLVGLIFNGWFPVCFSEDSGLTVFKIVSELVICLLFGISAFKLIRRYDTNAPMVYQAVAVSFLVSIVSELFFTLYSDFNGIANLIGHVFKAMSYSLLFNGVVIEGMVSPFRKLKDTEKALREEQLHYSQTMAAVRDGMFRYLPDSDILEVSPVWEDMTGHYPENHILTLDDLKKLVHPEDFPRMEKAFMQVAVNSWPLKEEIRLRHSSGKWFWVLIRGRIFSGRDKGRYFMGIMTDISWRKKIERELIRAKEKAEESDRLKTAFLANISHEIRTPLNVIMGFSNLLIKETPLEQDDARSTYVRLIRQSANQLISIISDIIDISRIQNNQIRLYDQEIDLTEMLQNLFMIYRKLMDDQGKDHIRLSFKTPEQRDGDLTVVTDLDRFHQIWQNLLNNAMKFTEYGQIVFGIQDISAHQIVFFVQDTGPGIPAGKEQIIFEQFRQAEEGFSRHFGGSGLGLTITRELLTLMGGFITVDREYRKGAMFLFTIPRKSLAND